MSGPTETHRNNGIISKNGRERKMRAMNSPHFSLIWAFWVSKLFAAALTSPWLFSGRVEGEFSTSLLAAMFVHCATAYRRPRTGAAAPRAACISFFRWQFLYFFPLPQGHRSFRPILGESRRNSTPLPYSRCTT